MASIAEVVAGNAASTESGPTGETSSDEQQHRSPSSKLQWNLRAISRGKPSKSVRYYRKWKLDEPSTDRGNIWRFPGCAGAPDGLFDVRIPVYVFSVV
jgi:hypothetical protein